MKYFALTDPGLQNIALEKLKLLDIEPIPVPITALVEKPIAGHPDIQVFLHSGRAFVHPDINKNFLIKLENYCEVKICSTGLASSYPGDIAYNVAAAGNYAFHKKYSTAPEIAEYFSESGIILTEVKQGYTKCSTLIVDDNSIITADHSIHNSACRCGFDSLLISPGYIELPGYKYGFIGGASGRFMDMILFTGRIDQHPDAEKIYSFIESKGLSVYSLSDGPVYDAGSIMISSY